MIRFPPTSIALSESDIEFHLRDIQIKEHLYAQGFPRKEVQRYYNERHGTTSRSNSLDDDVPSTQPSTIGSQPGSKEPAADAVKALGLAADTRRPSGTSCACSDLHSF